MSGIELCLVEHLEKSYAAGALAEEAAQHAVLRPDMAIFGGDVLDDVICCGTQDIFCVVACCSEIPADRISFSKNLIASATCSIRLANDARRRATRRRPRSCRSGPAARIIGLALGATRSSTRRVGPWPSAELRLRAAVPHSGSTPRRRGWQALVRTPIAQRARAGWRRSMRVRALRPHRTMVVALRKETKALRRRRRIASWKPAARIGANDGSFAASEWIAWSVLIAH